MPVIRNPYLGQTIDPYGGAEWIDRSRSIPDISRHTLGPDQVVVEPRGTDVHVTYHTAPPDPSVSVVSMRAPLGADNSLPQFSHPQEHKSHYLRGVAVGTVAGMVALHYISKGRKYRIRVMWVLTVLLVICTLPFIGMAMLPPGNAGFLWFTVPAVILLALLWPAALRRDPLPPPSIQATYDRP